MSGAELIASERLRQIYIEGFSAEHDDQHEMGSVRGREYSPLRAAAMCYVSSRAATYFSDHPPSLWPWEPGWWKPSDEIRNLVKAGALIAAEIDRLQRKARVAE